MTILLLQGDGIGYIMKTLSQWKNVSRRRYTINYLFTEQFLFLLKNEWWYTTVFIQKKMTMLQRVHLISNRLIKAYDSYSCSRTGSTLLTSCKKIMCKSIHWLTDWPTNWHIDMKTFPMVNANRREEKILWKFIIVTT